MRGLTGSTRSSQPELYKKMDFESMLHNERLKNASVKATIICLLKQQRVFFEVAMQFLCHILSLRFVMEAIL